MKDIQTGNTAFMATQYFKIGDPLYDIPLAMMITIMMGILASLITEFTTVLGSLVSKLWTYIYTKTKNTIFGKQNCIIVEHIFDDDTPDVNNRLIIDVIKSNFEK